MEPNLLAEYGFGIKILQHTDGRIEHTSKSANTGIATEVIILRMKAILTQLEKDYPNIFDKSHTWLEK